MATYKDILLLVDKVSQPLKKIGENTEKTQKKMSKFKDKIKSFGQSFGKFGSKIMAFGKMAVGAIMAVCAAIAGIGTAIIRGANRFAEMGDRIDKMSQKIGMSRRAFQEWDYIMSQNGGNVESLQMGFKTLLNQIDGVRKGSKESIRTFKLLGVQIKDNNGHLRSADDIFNDTVRALQKMENPTQKMIYANKVFGRSAAELRPLLNQNADEIDKLREKADKKGLFLSDEDIKNAVEYKDTMDTFSRYFDAKFGSAMMSIMPDITKALEEIMQIYEENKDIFADFAMSLKWIIGTALPAMVKLLVWIMKLVRWIVVDAPVTLHEKITDLQYNIWSFFNNISHFVKITFLKIELQMKKVGEVIGNIFTGVLSSIQQWLEWIIERVSWLIGKMPLLNSALKGSYKVAQYITNNNVNKNTDIKNIYGGHSNPAINNMVLSVYNVP